MSPPPVLFETNASLRPSGEYRGRDSFAGWESNNRASPPAVGTAQISPPETNAISDRSGEIDGSVKYGREATALVWLDADPANAIKQRATKKAVLEVITVSPTLLQFVENDLHVG